MVDIKTHRIIDMINSREYESVKEWLKTYPNIRIVSRDGSITYHNAITSAHPDAIQISDRFHLLKNLTSYATDYLKKELKSHMQISISQVKKASVDDLILLTQAEKNRKLTLKEKYEQIENLISLGCNKTTICQNLNMDIRVYEKLITMTPSERDTLFQTNMMTVHEEKVKLKINKVNEVRELKNIGCSNREISRRTGLNTTTIRSYLDENFNPVHASYGKKKIGLLTKYIKDVDSMIEKGIMGTVIEEKIREMGYEGSSSTVRHYITDCKRRRKFYYDKTNENNSTKITIERKDVFKLLYHPIEKVKAISKEYFQKICDEYPTFEKVYNTIWNFKEILTNKDVDSLQIWINNADGLQIREITSFINGLKQDIEAVHNAIKYDYSNGLAEGSVNKLKVIKRIMYGRCSFETLRIKTLRLEKMRKIN